MSTSKSTATKAKARSMDPENALAPGLSELLTDCIMDIYWAENHLTKALPKMQKATSSKTLAAAISEHLEVTKGHVAKLLEVFSLLGLEPRAKKCDAMEGLVKEGEGVIEETEEGSEARNLGIIFASQKVEHYEIAAYTSMAKLAASLGFSDVADILSGILTEEEEADQTLSDIADTIMQGK